jgi:serine/threonine protein kinase
MSIHDAQGRMLVDISPGNARFDRGDGYLAYTARVTPGTYRIRTRHSRRDVAITIPAGRAAHAFIADTGTVRLDDLRISIVPVEAGFDPRSPLWEAMEIALVALRESDGRLPAAARELLPGAVDQDLCFGLAAGHLLHREGDESSLAAVLARLARFRELPDVQILEMFAPRTDGDRHRQSDSDSRRALPAVPPLLRVSLAIALTRPGLDWAESPMNDAFAEAARRRICDSVWCTWSTRAWDERWVLPAVDALRAKFRLDPGALARSLALPRETIDDALLTLDAATPVHNHGSARANDLVPEYVLRSVLGRGARSTVYSATRRVDGRTVALKIVAVAGGPEQCARVCEEISLTESVPNERILAPNAHGVLPDSTGVWLEMELCRGSLLDVLADADAPLPAPDAVRMVLEALDGLAALHERGIAHGNIQPANVLVRDDGSVVLAGRRLSAYRILWGPVIIEDTQQFIAPELVLERRPPSTTSDVWSMAATLYFVLSLEHPREQYSRQYWLDAVRENPVVPIAERTSQVPRELAHCLDKALSQDPRNRPADASALRALLLDPDSSAASSLAIEAGQDSDLDIPDETSDGALEPTVRVVMQARNSAYPGASPPWQSMGFRFSGRLAPDATRSSRGYGRLFLENDLEEELVLYEVVEEDLLELPPETTGSNVVYVAVVGLAEGSTAAFATDYRGPYHTQGFACKCEDRSLVVTLVFDPDIECIRCAQLELSDAKDRIQYVTIPPVNATYEFDVEFKTTEL